MKKMFLMLVAVAGMVMTSCDGCKKDAEKAAKDGAEKIEEIANEGAEAVDAATLDDELAKGLEANDGEGLKGKIDQAKAFASQLLSEGKGEEAKGIIEKIQNFLSENADKVKSVIGDNEYVQGALDWVKGVNAGELVDKAKDALGVDDAAAAGEAAKEAVADKAAASADAVKAAPEAAKEAAQGAVEAGKEAVDAAAEKGNAAIESAKEAVKAAPEAAKEAAAEAVEKGKEAVKEAAKDAVDKGIEKVGGLLKK